MTGNCPVKSGDLFFFYGTLKQGASGAPSHINLSSAGKFLNPATIRGDLYDLGDYPGVVPGQGVTHGIVYRLDDVSLVSQLDDYEEVTPQEPGASLYLRRLTPLLDSNLSPTSEHAWVYWYNQEIHHHLLINSGEWPA